MKHVRLSLFLISMISMILLIACTSTEATTVNSPSDTDDSAEVMPTEEATVEESSDTDDSAEVMPTEEATVEESSDTDDSAEIMPTKEATVEESSDTDDSAKIMPTEEATVEESSDTDNSAEAMTTEVSMRDSGLQVTVQNLGDVTVHTLTAPEEVFANSTHIIETPNSLLLIDTQFILPMALDYRAYADSLDKPIERLVITHEHPDHFLGSEAFADVEVYALAEVSDAIAANGQAEIDEKQGQFGDAIASTFVVPTTLEPDSVEIDGITFIFEVVENAEAEIQVVTKVPEYGVVSVGDIVYSGVHLILAGSPPTWTEALEALKAESADYPVVLAGHGLPGGPELYDQNIAWLAKAGELMGTASSGEEFKAGLIEAFPDLGMDAAIDFVLPFLFPTAEEESSTGLIEVITVELAEGATAEMFLPTDQVIKDEYASQQPGYLARETAVSKDGLVRLAVHWESKADSDASIAGFEQAPGLEAFMSNLNPETMVVKQYELLSSTSGQVTFPGAGAVEAITVRLQEGADPDGFLAANKEIEENHIVQQPGFIAREIGVTEDGEWLIVIHWETAEDSAASIAKFEEAPGVEEFMSFLDAETMAITVFDIQEESSAGLMDGSAEAMTTEVSMRDSGIQVTVQDLGDVTVHTLTAPEQVFANSTHIIETPNSLLLIDTQFILPMALDYRAYADSLDKPIERLVITHEHPDHFLGSEAFADVEVYALAEVSDAIAANGQAEIDEKQGQFGDAIASTFVVPTTLEPDSVEIDGITFIFDVVENAEAEIQVVTKVPEYGIVSVGDIVYSGVHLILAGSPPTWTEALEALKAESADYPVVLAGHGLPGGPELYDQNIAWLAKAGELMGTVSSGEEFKTGLVEAFPDLGMDAAIDFVLPFLFPTAEEESSTGLIEVITVELAEGATAETFLPTDQVIKDEYASQQPGYLARETAVSEDGLVRLAVHWESKADSDASIAGFEQAPGLEAFMSNLNPETMVVKQYELLSSTSGQVTFPGAGAVEAITVRLQEGADPDGFLAANKEIEENHIVQQPGFIAREIGVTEDGEWLIVIHWETAEDSAASIAKFEEAPGVEEFMSFLDAETMAITVFDIQEESSAGLMDGSAEAMTTEVSMRDSGIQVTVQDLGDVTVHTLTAPEEVFANSTHIIETPNSLLLIDTQFILPMALDYRAYADSLDKPIERLVMTHEHPDHFLGSEAFADVEVYALAEVSDAIAANGQAEIDEKQAQFGDAIASTFVVPTTLEPDSVEIDGITFIFDVVENAEAEIQVVTKVPEYGIVSVGDIVYSGVHLILAGSPPTWTEALEALKAESADYPVVLAGHGLPGGPELYDQNIAWLAKAGELMGTVSSGEEFKAGLIEAFPDLGMDAAIDFVLPFLFPTAEEESSTVFLLPERAGPRTQTTGTVPHVQIDVEPITAVNDELIRRAFALPGVEERPTIVSLPGALGMWLSDDIALAHPEAIVNGREFAHIHPDGSLHAPLPYERALEVAEKGWGERHPWADEREGWDGFVMLFTPQSMDELEVAFQLIVESYNHVTGQAVQASDFK